MPPTGLGMKRSDLSHKLHGFLHSARLELESTEHVRGFARSIITFTTDLGTEKGILSAKRDIDLA
eukprot:4534844-Alexandrium_andersonii.AAC.1